MFDCHTHSSVSFDGRDTITQLAQAAKTVGLSGLCVTDHLEIGYPAELSDIDIAPFDTNYYREQFDRAKSAVNGISLSFGVEAGLTTDNLKDVAVRIKQDGYDFVIASQHVVAGRDPYYGGFFEKYGVKTGQRMYLEELLTNINAFSDFDVIGHIGYADKYLPDTKNSENAPFTYPDFPELIDQILISAINRGKGIELNVSNLVYGAPPNPHPTILARYHQLNGEILTLGSDSHTYKNVGKHIADAVGLAREYGFKYICEFKNRQPVFHKI